MIAKAEEEYDCLYKIVLIGDSGVGKSNILSRFVSGTFSFESRTTIGVEFASKVIPVDRLRVMAQIWDTAGQEKYRSVTKVYYKGAVGAILVYDITNYESFKSTEKWIKEIREHADQNIIIMLAGNKSDLGYKRAVNTQEGLEYAAKHNMAFMETSALDSTNIDGAFTKLLDDIHTYGKQGNVAELIEPGKKVTAGRKLDEGSPTRGNEATRRRGFCCGGA